jgi:hypothetical protein
MDSPEVNDFWVTDVGLDASEPAEKVVVHVPHGLLTAVQHTLSGVH